MSKLSREEREIRASFGRGEWQSIPNADTKKEKVRNAAAATLRKERINIHLSSKDLQVIRKRAAKEGVPYEALISRVLHKYVSGQFVDKKRNAG